LDPQFDRQRYQIFLRVVPARLVVDVTAEVGVAEIGVGTGVIRDEVMPHHVYLLRRRTSLVGIALLEDGQEDEELLELHEPKHSPWASRMTRTELDTIIETIEHLWTRLEHENFIDLNFTHEDLLLLSRSP